MTMWVRIIRRLRHLFFGARARQELDEEITFHLEALAQDLVGQGMDPDEARREARMRFGAPEWVHQRSREERGLALFDETARNVRMALRGLARDPLFASTFVLTLALCIGLATAVFSVVDSVLWRSLPYPAPERLAQVSLYNPAFGKNPGNTGADGFTWERIRDEAAFLERAVYSGWARGVNLSTDEAAAFVRQQRVGAGYFGTLGVNPALGREFTAEEDVPEGPQVAILSHELWTRTFNGDPDLLGTTIRLKGEAHTVVGIMPPGFSSPAEADIWTPLRPSTRGEGSGTNYGILARIPSGMSFEEADARVAGIAPPQREEGAPELRLGLVPLDEALTAIMRIPMLVLLVGILLMLVVGCANLAGLQIARSLTRQSEMATRQALGSGTGALVRQMTVENIVLGVLGGGLGLTLAIYGIPALEALVQGNFGIWQSVEMNGRTLAVALGITLVTTVLFGLVPVLQVARPGAYRVLISGARVMGGSGHVLRKTLLVGQVAVVTALLFGAGLLVRSYGYLEGLDPGFDPDGVLSVQFSLEDARYADAESVDRLFTESLEGIGRIPGVRSAAVTLSLPYERPLNMGFRFPGEEDYRVVNVVYVTPGFFETLDIPMSQGRGFNDADRRGEPLSVVVNEAFARTHLAGEDPLGRRINIGFAGEDGATVVGVVGNVQQSAGWGDTNQPVWETPTVYSAAAQMPDGFFRGIHIWFSPSWVIRTDRSGASVAPQVTEVFRQAAPDLPVARTVTLPDVVDAAFAQQRFQASFLVIVAALALLLAGIGLYGIVAHEVMERRSEMGLRMALGATPGNAVWKTGLSGVRLTVLGLIVGTLGAVGVSRVIGHVLFGVKPFDPVVLAGLAVVLGVLAAVASFVPAARVGRMDPARILREG